MLDKEDMELMLLANEPIPLEHVGNITSPRMRDIIKLGYSKYNEGLSSLLFDKSRISDLKNVEESNFILTCFFFHQDNSFRNSFKNGIKFSLGKDVDIVEVEGQPVFDLGESLYIDETSFYDFQELVKLSNKVEFSNDADEYSAGNSKAKEMIERLLKGKAEKPQKKAVINLHSIISGLSWKSTSGINISNVFDLSVYQFYDGYHRLENIDYCNSVLTGIYTGNIDSKSIKMQEINWAKIIL